MQINELYYMKEEDLGDKTTKDHIYDRISCDSDKVADRVYIYYICTVTHNLGMVLFIADQSIGQSH